MTLIRDLKDCTGAVSRKFCVWFWQFNLLSKGYSHCRKSEYRNPCEASRRDQYETMSKSKCSKFKTKAFFYCGFLFWSLIFWSFKFVSSFDILISDFHVSNKCINYKHFDNISFCQFGMQNLWDGALAVYYSPKT